MFKRLRGPILVLALTLTVAAPAFGQSAGDDQYVDPFQQETGGGNGNSNGSQDDSTQSQTDTSAAPTDDSAVAGQADTTDD